MGLGISGSTQTSSLFALNAMRVQQNKLSLLSAQLSSGNRLVSGSVDPSGLAISQGFRAQMGGTDQAIYNAQDTISVTRTADSALGTQQAMLGRMRDLAVRSANSATLTAEDQGRLNNEFQSLSQELTRQGNSTSFNSKKLTTDVAGEQYGTQTAQIGPNNSVNDQSQVTIDASTANTLGPAGSEIVTQDISTTAGAQAAIDAVDTALNQVSNQRATLGVKENTLQYAVNDLSTSRINMAAANSRIADTDMASAITAQTNSLMMTQISMAALSQTKAQAYGVLKLIGAA